MYLPAALLVFEGAFVGCGTDYEFVCRAKDEQGRYIGTEPEGRGREVFGDRLL